MSATATISGRKATPPVRSGRLDMEGDKVLPPAAAQVYGQRVREQRAEVNAMFRWLMPAQWLFAVWLAWVVSPLAWEGLDRRVHPHVWGALLGGGLLSCGPLFCLLRQPFSRATPHVVAIGQMLFSALLIHLTGGRLETHFHVFGSLAILAFYLDRGVLMTAAGVVVADHLLRGWFLPESVYGVTSAGWWRSLEHGGWVLFEVFFLIHFAHRSMKRTFRQAAETAAAGQELEDGSRRLRLVIESAYDAYAAMDSGGRITEWNGQARKTFGWSSDEVLGCVLSEVLQPERSTDRQTGCRTASAASREKDGSAAGPLDLRSLTDSGTGAEPAQGQRTELTAVCRDGSRVPVELTISVVSWKGGLLYNVFMRDITARLEHERREEEMHQRLLTASRQAGKAEVAVGVLHNVGNVLNSVNVAAGMISDTARGSRVKALGDVVALIRSRQHDLADFLTRDPRGRLVPELLGRLADGLKAENDTLTTEAASLVSHVAHIRETVALQQSHATVAGITERLVPATLLEDALKLEDAAMVRHHIGVEIHVEETPRVMVDRHKTLQILVNLLRNAKQALSEEGPESRAATGRTAAENSRRIRLEVAVSRHRPDCAGITVRDNGPGILPEDLTRIFGHGFTTRAQGHGFGLHISALAAREMEGELTVESGGPGQGAAFTLHLPLAAPDGVRGTPEPDGPADGAGGTVETPGAGAAAGRAA